MSVQFAETVAFEDERPKAGHRNMKFTFPPESKPLDGYTIKRAIHRGGFGEVYFALTDSGKEVALKLLRNNLQVELRGVEQCLNLKHPNLVTIFDIKTDGDDDHWIIMEYVGGKNLATVIDEADGPLPLEQASLWLSGMVAGLGHLHDCGIVHRDLKPANVFEEAGVVKVGDVGLSKFITESHRSAQTESVGTVYYMAPEVSRGRYMHEIDVYALGVVLYEMLTGHVPFDGESTAEILMKHLTEKPDLAPLPSRLRPVLARALEKDPEKRTPSVQQLEAEFKAALRGEDAAVDIPEESFAGHTEKTPTVEEVVEIYRGKAKHLRREAKKAAKAAGKAARHEYKAACKRRKAAKYENRAAATATDQANRHRQTTHTRPNHGPQWAQAAKILAVILVVMALFTPEAALGSLKFLFVGGIFATFAFGLYRLFGLLTVPFQQSQSKIVSGSRSNKTMFARHVRQLTPETLRTIPSRNRLTDLTGTMTYAVLITALVSVGTWAVMPGLFANGDPGYLGLFAVITLLGAWAVLIPSKLWEGTNVQPHVRRLALLGTGALVGAAGYWLHQNLMVDVNHTYGSGEHYVVALFDQAGSRGLIGGDAQPTLAGYMIFFGTLFGIRRWWRHTDAFRKKRLRIGSLMLTGLAGAVLPLVFAFPQMWGLMWAVAISMVVQLSSVWATPADRQQLLEERTDA